MDLTNVDVSNENLAITHPCITDAESVLPLLTSNDFPMSSVGLDLDDLLKDAVAYGNERVSIRFFDKHGSAIYMSWSCWGWATIFGAFYVWLKCKHPVPVAIAALVDDAIIEMDAVSAGTKEMDGDD